MDWIDLAEDRDRWRASLEGFCSFELVSQLGKLKYDIHEVRL
jgi:hypothetical protein